MERRLRTLPRPRQRTCRAPDADQHLNPSHMDSVLRATPASVPLPRPARTVQSKESITTGRSAITSDDLQDYWKLEDHHARRAQIFSTLPTARPTEPHAGKRLCAERHVRRGSDLPLPRRPRHRQLRAAAQAGEPTLPRLSCGRIAERPTTAKLEEHTHHKAGSPGSQCVACHMPRSQRKACRSVRGSHTFKFITPAMTDKYKIPNPCTSCHTDKSTAWANDAMRQWNERSPWRLGQNPASN